MGPSLGERFGGAQGLVRWIRSLGADSSFPNSIWERDCRRNSIAFEVREMEFRGEQGMFPSATWERGELTFSGLLELSLSIF
jgi:hypothetical protein